VTKLRQVAWFLLPLVAQGANEVELVDDLLTEEADTKQPCLIQRCEPVCHNAPKDLTVGAIHGPTVVLPRDDSVRLCAPDTKCLAANARCRDSIEEQQRASDARLANAVRHFVGKVNKAVRSPSGAGRRRRGAKKGSGAKNGSASFKRGTRRRRKPSKKKASGQCLELKNANKRCLGRCGGKQGPCPYCGSGLCCKFGSDDKSGGCDGTIGKQEKRSKKTEHVCAENPLLCFDKDDAVKARSQGKLSTCASAAHSCHDPTAMGGTTVGATMMELCPKTCGTCGRPLRAAFERARRARLTPTDDSLAYMTKGCRRERFRNVAAFFMPYTLPLSKNPPPGQVCWDMHRFCNLFKVAEGKIAPLAMLRKFAAGPNITENPQWPCTNINGTGHELRIPQICCPCDHENPSRFLVHEIMRVTRGTGTDTTCKGKCRVWVEARRSASATMMDRCLKKKCAAAAPLGFTLPPIQQLALDVTGRAEAAWEEGIELGDAVAGKARARQGWSPATPTPTQTLNLATAIDDDSCMM